MKCERCGTETGASWKRYCSQCWKAVNREREDRCYLEAARAGNISLDLDHAEDSYDLD